MDVLSLLSLIIRFYPMKSSSFILTCSLCFLASCVRTEKVPLDSEGVVGVESIALSPSDSVATMELPAGYSLESVVSEPIVQEPVLVVFDANSRMYVAEMRTYMQDVDATGEFEPRSRVSMHEDTNGDGDYDRHTVFVDGLMLPRVVLPLDDRIIIGETNTEALYSYRDTDGDGVADEKKLWLDGGVQNGNLEHQSSGLIWAIDNSIYLTRSEYSYKVVDGKVEREPIPRDQGQWGLSQDNLGKLWYVDAGGERGPVHYQQHISYGRFEVEGQTSSDFREVWPIDNIPDTQGGDVMLREDNTLKYFTATCGADIFRGDRLPEDLQGDLIFAEPVGRLVRRAKVEVEDGITKLRNAYEQSEFIRSKDPLFRPVNMVTAPDGTLYIVDMYRGIIQEGNWTKEGSYLREQILKHGLDREIGGGRIYRLVHDDFEPAATPRMLDETPADWVGHLSHPNGWWRDTAQKLIVLKQDLSVVPALIELAESAESEITRIHALWTLDGLGALDRGLMLQAVNSTESVLRMTGLRLVEADLADAVEGDELWNAVLACLESDDASVAIQAMLSLKKAKGETVEDLTSEVADASDSAGVYAIFEQMWKDEKEDPFVLSQLGLDGLKSYRRGASLYEGTCMACHGADGKGVPTIPGKTVAPPLAGSARVIGDDKAVIDIVLRGLNGPIDGVDYGAPMISMAYFSDEQLADILTYVRNSFGNRSNAVVAETVAASRESLQSMTGFWTMDTLIEKHSELSRNYRRFDDRSTWSVSASHAQKPAMNAIDGDLETAFQTGLVPYPGVWFTVEFPENRSIKSIIMDCRFGKGERFPVAYEVHVSENGEDWGDSIYSALGESLVRIHLEKAVSGKYVRIRTTDSAGWRNWSLKELYIYGSK